MARKVAAGAKKGPSAPRSHALPEKFPNGIVLKDLFKKEWQLGNVLGQGGFGLIYLAAEATERSVDQKTANWVIKIEPKDNGPLFCEAHFYQRVAKLEFIEAFVSEHKLRYLGIPPYIATGIEKYKSKEYRFLVMHRFGTDLQKLLQEHGGQFAPHTTFAVGLRMVDALQFLHEKEYVHADIKASNILLGFSKGNCITNEVYLVDYGLAYRYTVDNKHKEYKEDLKRAHDGTIEFTSRDAHKGLAPSRRGDLEILGYCLLQWLCGKLPWENNLINPSYVAASKESFMGNLQTQLAKCLPKNSVVSDCMYKYFQQVNRLEYHSKPNYKQLRDILRTGLVKSGQKDEWVIDFTVKGKKRKRGDKDSGEDTPSSSLTDLPPKKSPKLKQSSPRARQSPSSTNLQPQKSLKPTLSLSRAKKSPSSKRLSPKFAQPSPGAKQSLISPKLPNASKASTSAAEKKKNSAPATFSKTASPVSAGRGRKWGPSSSTPHPKGKEAFNGSRPKKYFPMPAPTNAATSTAKIASTKRTVRRVAAVQSDISVQTSPSLMQN